MRVIGGSARGRPLRAPRSPAVRPTADRVREAIFDVLGNLDAVEDASVLDGFAGSGALGIEALSRGARSVTFVELERDVLSGLSANLRAAGFSDHSGVRTVRGDLLAFLGERPHFDLVLLDPPYRFERWPQLLALVRAEVAVIESDREVDLPEQLQQHRTYRYGSTLVTVARAPRQAGEAAQAARPGRGFSAGRRPAGPDEARRERA